MASNDRENEREREKYVYAHAVGTTQRNLTSGKPLPHSGAEHVLPRHLLTTLLLVFCVTPLPTSPNMLSLFSYNSSQLMFYHRHESRHIETSS